MRQPSRFQWSRISFAGALFLLSLPLKAVARPVRGIGIDVDFVLQLGGPVNVTSFSFYIFLAVMFVVYALGAFRNMLSHNEFVRGGHYAVILVSAICLITYDALGAVWMSQDPPDPYADFEHYPDEVLTLKPSFYAFFGAVEKLGDLFLLGGILALLDYRMGVYSQLTLRMAPDRILKWIFDGVLLLALAICLILIGVSTGSYQDGYGIGSEFYYRQFTVVTTSASYVIPPIINFYEDLFESGFESIINTGRAYTAFYVIAVLDIVITAVVLLNQHVKNKPVVDPVLSNLAIYASPLLLGRALFKIAVCIIESPVNTTFDNTATLALVDIIVSGFLYLLVFVAVINAGARKEDVGIQPEKSRVSGNAT
ncbi:hypothetical protein BDN72DRAFT_881599 [Pluteus cervinus]|uniref:Uncharacterized protein n=1 Tax=Pluteus cervinus TaxID=181527 RepID=A0ACD3AF20_9AGAR|nr:hypothetical protein BDN72DRAFT_881599 [Pluteus cervinus]